MLSKFLPQNERFKVSIIFRSILKIALGVLICTTALSGTAALAVYASCAAYFLTGFVMIYVLHRNPQYRLVESTWSVDDLCGQIDSSIRDLLVLLPCALYLNQRFSIVKIILEPDSPTSAGAFFYLTPLQWSFVPVGVLVGLVWRMFVHRLLHHPKLYRLSHKMHHLQAAKMTPFSAFTDHPLEFLCMEVVGTFFLPAALQPLPVRALAVLWAAQCVLGVLDHCNAHVPFVCDSRYHLVHHQVPTYLPPFPSLPCHHTIISHKLPT